MGFVTTSLFEARVDFYGLDESEEAPFRASVSHDAPGAIDSAGGTNSLSLLIPLLASRLLHNSRMAPATTGVMMELLSKAANRLLESESEAEGFDFRDVAEEVARDSAAVAAQVGGLDPDEIAMLRGVPILLGDAEDHSDQHARYELMENRRRGRVLWAKVHAPWRGPHFFSTFGLFMLMQRTANDAPYEEVTVPAMAAVAGLAHLYFEDLDGEGWENREVAQALDARVRLIAAADDARAALEDLGERA
jgi:hypothetical protein